MVITGAKSSDLAKEKLIQNLVALGVSIAIPGVNSELVTLAINALDKAGAGDTIKNLVNNSNHKNNTEYFNKMLESYNKMKQGEAIDQ